MTILMLFVVGILILNSLIFSVFALDYRKNSFEKNENIEIFNLKEYVKKFNSSRKFHTIILMNVFNHENCIQCQEATVNFETLRKLFEEQHSLEDQNKVVFYYYDYYDYYNLLSEDVAIELAPPPSVTYIPPGCGYENVVSQSLLNLNNIFHMSKFIKHSSKNVIDIAVPFKSQSSIILNYWIILLLFIFFTWKFIPWKVIMDYGRVLIIVVILIPCLFLSCFTYTIMKKVPFISDVDDELTYIHRGGGYQLGFEQMIIFGLILLSGIFLTIFSLINRNDYNSLTISLFLLILWYFCVYLLHYLAILKNVGRMGDVSSISLWWTIFGP